MAELWSIAVVILATMIGSWGSLLFKIGAKELSPSFSRLIKNYPIVLGCLLYFVSSVMFIISLKGGELSVLYPFVSLNYIWIALLSIKFLKEKMGFWKWAGIALIIIGVSFIGLGS